VENPRKQLACTRCGAVRCGREGYYARTATNLDTVSTTESFRKTAIAM
jgi:hypothetical protein